MLAWAGACGGGGGDRAPVFMPVSTTTDGTTFTMTLGDLKMVIDGAHGARITEFSLFGKNALVTVDENANYGATFWPSPQSAWCTSGVDCWPPPDAIDSGLYNGQINSIDMSIAFASDGLQTFPTPTGAALTAFKVFTPNPSSGAIEITYVLTNESTAANTLTFSPWQVSRVAAGGLTFFAPGGGPVTYAPNTASTFMVNEAAGALWYTSAPVTHDSKAFADGTGWIGHVTPDRQLFLLSTYSDVAADRFAPGEAEVELFTNSSYVEVEMQGAYIQMFVNDSITWTVRWKLRPLPAGMQVAEGNADLVSLATMMLSQ
jgi:hypothetical protein